MFGGGRRGPIDCAMAESVGSRAKKNRDERKVWMEDIEKTCKLHCINTNTVQLIAPPSNWVGPFA